MKPALAILVLAAMAGPLNAQSSAPQTAAPPTVEMQMQCRDVATTGNFLQPNETYVNGMACHPVAPPAAAQPPAVKPADPVPADQTQATIYFYRPHRFVGAALRPTVFVDDAREGRLHNGDSIKVSVAPGSHRIYSTDKSMGMDLDVKAGETYYVRIDIQTGFFKGHGGVTLVDPQQGKYEAGQAARQGADDNQ